jgi:hypothetical protein
MSYLCIFEINERLGEKRKVDFDSHFDEKADDKQANDDFDKKDKKNKTNKKFNKKNHSHNGNGGGGGGGPNFKKSKKFFKKSN